MLPFIASITFAAIVWLAIVVLNEKYALLSCDHFPSATAKYIAYAWLGLFMIGLAFLVTGSGLSPATTKELANMPFVGLFLMHAILVVFLIGWWALSGMPDLRTFFNIRHERPLEVVAIGVSVGVGGWIFTIMALLLIALLLQATGMMTEPSEPPAMVGFLGTMPVWKKALIILSAMTVEEAFFRSFLQKRIGLIASTILFALAHFTYGNPVFLIGVSIVSIIIGITFYRTKNVIPGVIAHGVFDAIQLFVIIPIAVKMIGAGA